jgi:hypothetical protein
MEFWPANRLAEYHREGLRRVLSNAIRDAEASYRSEHPEAASLRTRADILVWRKRPRGFSRHRIDLVRLWLDSPATLAETNDAVVERLKQKFNPHPVPASILTREIPSGAKKEISELLAQRGRALDIARHNTLSKIKRALRAQEATEAAPCVHRVNVTFAAAAVIVGDRSYPVTPHANGYGRIRVGRQWLRCDVLETLLTT